MAKKDHLCFTFRDFLDRMVEKGMDVQNIYYEFSGREKGSIRKIRSYNPRTLTLRAIKLNDGSQITPDRVFLHNKYDVEIVPHGKTRLVGSTTGVLLRVQTRFA